MEPIEGVTHSTSISLPFLAFNSIVYEDNLKLFVANETSAYV